MNHFDECESGFVIDTVAEESFSRSMTDVEILRVTQINVIARGSRYGRRWLIKGLRQDLADSTAFRHRLMKEFEIHSRLHHPSVAHAVGFEEVEGIGMCLIMEWIEGETLSEAIHKGELSKQERRRIMHDTIDAIAYIHSCGVVHRDLKPSNIMLRRAGGKPVVIDFGLADTDDYVELKNPSGTRGFISPEQMERGGANTADDIYSLGVTMNSLYPEYSNIWRRCMSRLGKRPIDARAVRRAVERRERRPKLIMWSLLAAVVVITGVLTGIRIAALSRTAKESEERMTVLAEENRKNLTHVTDLTDSLEHVGQRLAAAEEERKRIEDYAAAKDKAYKDGCSKVNAILKRYDREKFSKFTPDDGKPFIEAQQKMMAELRQTVEQHCDRLPATGLSKMDCEKIRADLCNYYTVTFSDFYNKWIKKVYPNMNI